MGFQGIRDAYETGRGRMRMRAVAHIEPQKGGHEAIVITELPYQVKKGGDDGVIRKIAELVNDKVLNGIRNIADQSDKQGMRIWIELKRGEVAKVVLNNLYKHTPLQSTFGANMVALVDGTPRTLGLKALLRHYVDHQKEVVTRRTKFRLDAGRAAGAHPRGLPDRARQPRRGHRAHPRVERRRRRARRGLIETLLVSARSRRRRSSTCACSALTSLETEAIRTRARRADGADRRAAAILGDEKRVSTR